MKAILSVAVVASMLGGVSTLQAATNNTKAGVKAKPAAKKTISTKVVNSESRLKFDALIENEYGGESFYDNGVTTGATNVYLTGAYKISDTTSFKVTQVVRQEYAEGERTKASVEDTYLQFTDSKAFKIGTQDIGYYLRAYLPTSIATREDNNQYMELRLDVSSMITTGKGYFLRGHVQGRYYAAEKYKDAQPKEVVVNENTGQTVTQIGDINGNGDVNKDFRIRPYFSGNLDITGKLSFYQQLGYERTWMKDSSGGQSHLYAFSELGYQVTPSVGLSAAAYSSKPMSTATAALYNAADSLYFLNATVKF